MKKSFLPNVFLQNMIKMDLRDTAAPFWPFLDFIQNNIDFLKIKG